MANIAAVEAPDSTPVSAAAMRILCKLARFLFGGGAIHESIATRVHIDAAPESVWSGIAFYEEVPGKPPALLASILFPLGTEGEKSEVGARVLCRYRQGNLVKEITAVEIPCIIRFDVMEQHLGIEGCAIAQSGSYRILCQGAGSEVVLTTNYRAFLHPRWVWRLVEKRALHQLHGHILNGMSTMVAVGDRPPMRVTTGRVCRGEEA